MKRRQTGSVFVFSLAILSVIVAIVASVAVTESVALDQQTYSQNQARARLAAEAGIQRAVEVLSDESASGTTTSSTNVTSGSNANQPGVTTLQDDWSTLGSTGSDRFQLNGASFRLQILDAASRVNVNTATQAGLQNLPLTQEQIDALMDWRTAGQNARPDGAKDSYYNGLANPYDTALRSLSTVSELLDVRYFTPADLYDAPQNTPIGGQPLQNYADGRTPVLYDLLTVDSVSPAINQQGRNKTALRTLLLQQCRGMFGRVTGTAVYNNRNSTTWAQLIRGAPGLSTGNLRTLLNNYYVGTSTQQAGKVNVNTAPAAVLQTLPGITSDVATQIVNNQSTGYTQLGNVLNIPGLTSVRSATNVIDNLSINSTVFLARVIGYCGKAQVPLEAVLSVTPAPSGQYATVKILRMEEQPFNDMTGRWGWQTSTNNDISLEAGS